jgi:Spy/CpxP family protein refolding chaperone
MLRMLMIAAGLGLLLQGQAAAAPDNASPYAGMEHRPIKALSEQEIEDLRQGRGMGLALAAELNHYPGPLHALDAAAALGLDVEQLQRTEALFEAMQAEAIARGEAIIGLEAELEALFASGTAAPSEVERLVMTIAEARGRLRYVHLSYHLEMRDLLTPEQLGRYDQVRGYAHGGGGEHRHRH